MTLFSPKKSSTLLCAVAFKLPSYPNGPPASPECSGFPQASLSFRRVCWRQRIAWSSTEACCCFEGGESSQALPGTACSTFPAPFNCSSHPLPRAKLIVPRLACESHGEAGALPLASSCVLSVSFWLRVISKGDKAFFCFLVLTPPNPPLTLLQGASYS